MHCEQISTFTFLFIDNSKVPVIQNNTNALCFNDWMFSKIFTKLQSSLHFCTCVWVAASVNYSHVSTFKLATKSFPTPSTCTFISQIESSSLTIKTSIVFTTKSSCPFIIAINMLTPTCISLNFLFGQYCCPYMGMMSTVIWSHWSGLSIIFDRLRFMIYFTDYLDVYCLYVH